MLSSAEIFIWKTLELLVNKKPLTRASNRPTIISKRVYRERDSYVTRSGADHEDQGKFSKISMMLLSLQVGCVNRSLKRNTSNDCDFIPRHNCRGLVGIGILSPEPSPEWQVAEVGCAPSLPKHSLKEALPYPPWRSSTPRVSIMVLIIVMGFI